jgi:uncharacterized membrane protein YccF (DUF307 family)
MADDSPSLVVRAIWFVAVGWWLTGVLLSVAWALNVTIVGLPVGIKLINMVPKALTLKSAEKSDVDRVEIGGSSGGSPGLLVRGAYFVFVGWWASLLWMGVAYLLCLSVLGLPVGIVMFNKLPKVVSLYEG